jgi:hypothetical protein
MSKSNRLSSLFAVMGAIFPAKALTSANRNFDELAPRLLSEKRTSKNSSASTASTAIRMYWSSRA